jgi:hypothetical protein
MNKTLLPSTELSNVMPIENCIYYIRDKQVMLDSDLAAFFQVDTKRLNQQMKRNQDRFPEDFCFKLNSVEFKYLTSQNATSSYGGRRYQPYVYTEQGILVLAGVLKSDIAAKMSVEIARVFVRMRKYLLENKDVLIEITDIKNRQLEFEDNTNKRFELLFNKLDKMDIPKSKLFFNNEWFDAYEYIVNIIKKAKESIILIDPYLDDKALSYLAHKNTGVSITLVYSDKSKLNIEEINRFISQYGELTTKVNNDIHDRFLIIDNQDCYALGTSLNYTGSKIFLINKIENQEIVKTIIRVSNS